MEKLKDCIIGISILILGYSLFKLIIVTQPGLPFNEYFDEMGYIVPMTFSIALMLTGIVILIYDFFKNKNK